MNTSSPAQVAAADLAARIVHHAEKGPLQGLAAEVEAIGGRVVLTITELPGFAVTSGLLGIGPSVEGARMTAVLHGMAAHACAAAGVTMTTVVRISPEALAEAYRQSILNRRAS